MAVISISRQYGAGGTVVADDVARRLGYKLVEREIINQVAKEGGVSSKWVEEVEKGAGDRLARLLSEWVATNPMVRNLPDPTVEFDEDQYRQYLWQVITRTAQEGNVVFVGRGSQYILREFPGVVRCYLVAGEEERIASLVSRFEVSRERAELVVRREEKKRLAFLRAFKGPDPEEPTLYHMVINTGLVRHEKAADFVCRLAAEQEFGSG